MHLSRLLRSSRFHLFAMLVWALLTYPTVEWWSESILWLALMSLYSNFSTHWSAYQGARSEEQKQKE